MSDPALVWTFRLVGGERFSLQLPKNPGVAHDGSLSIWHLRITGQDAAAVGEVARGYGAKVDAHAQTESDEQTAMHQRYMEAETSVFPCTACVKCYWLDLQAEGYCGADAWEPSKREAALSSFEAARDDLAACPVR